MAAELSISEKIQEIRRRRGLSQEDLARQLGVSFPTVNAWERGKSQPYPRHVRAIDELYQDTCLAGDREVLIVEDDHASGLVLADYVQMALPDWHSTISDNGYDAILQIGLKRPALVLLDIMMPGLDGFEVYRRIQEQSDLQHVRVIFVTAASDPELLARARDSGAFALLQKPLDREQVLAALREAAALALR